MKCNSNKDFVFIYFFFGLISISYTWDDAFACHGTSCNYIQGQLYAYVDPTRFVNKFVCDRIQQRTTTNAFWETSKNTISHLISNVFHLLREGELLSH